MSALALGVRIRPAATFEDGHLRAIAFSSAQVIIRRRAPKATDPAVKRTAIPGGRRQGGPDPLDLPPIGASFLICLVHSTCEYGSQ
jgi:hypothetical protein